MNEVKPHLSYEGQINKLREKGCIIDDDSFCRNVLVNIGYYRLSAYFLPFKSFDGTYMDNLHLKEYIEFMNLTESSAIYYSLLLKSLR